MRRLLLGALTGTLIISTSLVTAQDAGPTPMGAITIPDDVKIFVDTNPNLRKATAVVNGDIITGTDVDQRLARENGRLDVVMLSGGFTVTLAGVVVTFPRAFEIVQV